MSNDADATLYIDAWGTFFRQILSPRWFLNVESNCGCRFKQRTVCVNNIDPSCTREFWSTLGQRRWYNEIDEYIDVKPVADFALSNFGLKKEDFTPLEYQSTADLAAIYNCDTEYIVFFAGDAIPWGSSNWVADGIKLLEERSDIMAVNPVWNGLLEHARCWSNPTLETEHFFLGHGFSDQCYLARTADLKGRVYHETNAQSDKIYPQHHGNQFEKRVDAWMRNHGKLRATLKNAAYITRP